MPDVPDHPIAYTALTRGTPVHTDEGVPFATVETVLVDELVSVFDGIVVQTPQGNRFVDADQIGSIYVSRVRTTLSPDEAADLPAPDGSNLIHIKPGGSLTAKLGRMFGRGKR